MPASKGRPSPETLDRALRALRPWRVLTSPKFIGLDRVPDDERPLLFVGNHTLYGILDAPLMFAELYTQKGILLRSLGDHLHFKIPLWRAFLSEFGVVDGTRENCARLMEAGEAILVFPGGGREVAKRRGEKYKLIWKERTGFARMAIRHGCTIVPFAAVGAEETYDIVLDANDVLASPLGHVIRALKIRPDIVPPLAKGAGGGPLPRPERFYFYFGEPIPTRDLAGRDDDEDAVRRVREQVREAVEGGVAWLEAYRARDPKRALLPRVVGEIKRSVLGAKGVTPRRRRGR